MGYRDQGDGTWVFDHEHECEECGAAIGCDGSWEQEEVGSSRGYCDSQPDPCVCDECYEAAQEDDDVD